MWVYRTMIVPAAVASQCRELAAAISPPGAGAGMWEVGLSPTGQSPATHYVSAGLIGTDFAELLDSPVALAEATSAPVEQINALLSVCDVSAEYVADALARLGLQLVQPDEPI